MLIIKNLIDWWPFIRNVAVAVTFFWVLYVRIDSTLEDQLIISWLC